MRFPCWVVMCLLLLEMVYNDGKGIFNFVKAFILLVKAFTSFLPELRLLCLHLVKAFVLLVKAFVHLLF